MVFPLLRMNAKLQLLLLQKWREKYQREVCKLGKEVPVWIIRGVRFLLDVRHHLVLIGLHITKPNQILDRVVFIQYISWSVLHLVSIEFVIYVKYFLSKVSCYEYENGNEKSFY